MCSVFSFCYLFCIISLYYVVRYSIKLLSSQNCKNSKCISQVNTRLLKSPLPLNFEGVNAKINVVREMVKWNFNNICPVMSVIYLHVERFGNNYVNSKHHTIIIVCNNCIVIGQM